MPRIEIPLDKTKMGELHEVHLADVFGGRKSRGSGNQWDDPADGRNDHTRQALAFSWDGKSTTGSSITVSLAMIEKIREQAKGERPAIGLRWYGNQALTLVDEDGVLITTEDMEELLAEARQEGLITAPGSVDLPPAPETDLPGYVTPPPPQAMEPRTVIYSRHATGGQLVNQGVRILPGGASELFSPFRVGLDNSASGQQQLAVDDQIMRHADWYVDNVLTFTVG
jgi:hypothetical protein